MTMMTVLKDQDNNIIHIGEWIVEDIGQEPPQGSYEDTADIVVGWDGGLYVADDPRRLEPNS